MNLKLVLVLSMIAFIAALATVYVIPPAAFSVCWLTVMFLGALGVGRFAPGKFFRHGFLVGLLNWLWVTASHVLLYDAWVVHHAQDLAGMQSMAGLPGWMRRYGVPVPGASGAVIGAVAWALARIPGLRTKAEMRSA